LIHQVIVIFAENKAVPTRSNNASKTFQPTFMKTSPFYCLAEVDFGFCRGLLSDKKR